MNTLLNKVDGHKTNIGTLIIFVAGGLYALGYIDQKTMESVATMGGAIAAYGVRDAIRKIK